MFDSPATEKNTEVSNYIETLRRDGILKIENFLSDAELDAIRAEYENVYEDFIVSSKITVPVQKRYWVSRSTVTASEFKSSKANAMKQSFLANDTIKNIIEGAIKRKVKILPAAAYTEEYYQAEDLGKDSQNPTVMPHYDVPYHSYKAFFYLDDVDEGNGVFHYSIGSHRFNLRRLILEYFTSINVSAKKTPQVNYNDSKHLGTYKEAMIPMIGKKIR
ncbi:MAG: hypothetical protein GKR95_13835 [Gammaproteobacteria bacterium]|nr:hypothetical protein [Gammaproteobacteria bacterium]